MEVYIKLFIAFLKVGMLSFGGGYAAIPLIQDEVVTKNAWLTMAEFADLVTVSQMTPGPIAVNSATFVGFRLAGPIGGIVASLASVLPAIILVTFISWMYFKYRSLDGLQVILETLRPAVVAMIATAGVSILVTAFWPDSVIATDTQWNAVAIFIFCMYGLLKRKWDPIAVIVLSGAMNIAWHLVATGIA